MMTSWTETMTSYWTETMTSSLFQNAFILRIPRIAIFADIIKIGTMFIKASLKIQKMLKELEIIYRNAIIICTS